jgi:hypothetical protein
VALAAELIAVRNCRSAGRPEQSNNWSSRSIHRTPPRVLSARATVVFPALDVPPIRSALYMARFFTISESDRHSPARSHGAALAAVGLVWRSHS